MRLTERNLKAVEPPAKGRLRLSDEAIPGFCAIVRPNGTISFALRYKIRSRDRLIAIGPWPEWSATAARDRALELRQEIARGGDPLDAKQAKRAAMTVRQLADLYCRKYAQFKRTGERDRAYLDMDVLPKIGSRIAADITSRDVRRVFEAKSDTPIAANRLLSIVGKMFRWAVEQEILDSSPCFGIKKHTEKPKQRALSPQEIRKLWLQFSESPSQIATILRLILATAQRPGEVAGMRWDEIEDQWWTIPGDRTKNGKPNRVWLPQGIVELLPEGEGVVFPGSYVAALSRFVKSVDCLGMEPWMPHDLRRTASTQLATLGVLPHVIDRILNHTDPSTRERHYNLYAYDKERKEAAEKWAEVLLSRG